MLWPKVVLIAGHSFMFGWSVSVLGSYIAKDTYEGAIFHDIDMAETWKQSLATALVFFGAMVSALSSSMLTNPLGNKKSLTINSIIWIIAGVFCAFHNLYTFFCGRFIMGLGVGLASTIPPVLLSEIAPASNKGAIASMHQLMITLGILITGIASYWVVHVQHGWWYMNSLALMVFGVFLFFTSFILPESPSWLLNHGQEHEALETLRSLRKNHKYEDAIMAGSGQQTSDAGFYGENGSLQSVTSGLNAYDMMDMNVNLLGSPNQDILINQEMQQLRNAANKGATGTDEELTWGQVMTKRYSKQILIGTGLMFSSSLIGINAVVAFAAKLMKFAGLDDKQASLGTIALFAMAFFMSFVAMVLVEKLGRKTLYIIGSIGSTISLSSLGAVLLVLNEHTKLQGILAVGLLISFLVFFNLGIGGLSWVLASEITHCRVRNKLQSLFCFQNWLGNFLIVLSALPLINFFGGGDSDEQEKKGAAILFLFFAAIGILVSLFSMFVLVETKGLTETQIQMKLGNDDTQFGDIEDDDIFASSFRGTV